MSDKSGYVNVDLSPDFKALGVPDVVRLPEITKLLTTTPMVQQKIDIYYEFAKPYDSSQKTIFMAGGFYPWIFMGPNIANNFPELFNNYNLLQLHYRGTGCSTAPVSTVNPLYFTHEMVAADLEAVRKSLKIDKLHSWASSNGAFIMLTYSLMFPDSVDKILLRDISIRMVPLLESSSFFETKLLPELLSPAQLQQLQEIKNVSEEVYDAIMRLFGTFLMREAQQRSQMPGLVSSFYDETIVKKNPTAVIQMIAGLLQSNTATWSEATTANECVDTKDQIFENLDIDKMYMVYYVAPYCREFQKTNKDFLIKGLDFTGKLAGLKNSFFVYNGYWDDNTNRELAVKLAGELPNSQVFIDKRAGHGEISQETYPCYRGLMNLFYSGASQKDLNLFIAANCQ
jgi:pimeloyl-ACP methyl ester carboxylesterase